MKTEVCFPCPSTFHVFIPRERGIMSIPVKICRVSKEGNKYVGMGLTLVEKTEKYLNFVDNLKIVFAK